MSKWQITDIGTEFVADNGDRTVYLRGEHCRACALVKLLLEHGGDVDMRGLHRYGICADMLAITAHAGRTPSPD